MANLGTNCTTTSTFTGVSATTKCKQSPGLSTVYTAQFSELDTTAMALPANFSTTNCGAVTGFVMTGGATFKSLANDGFSTTYTRVKSGGKYTHTITLEYLGFDCLRDCQLSQLENLLCNAVFAVETNGCFTMLLGVKSVINGATVTLSKDNATRKITANNLDAKTSSSEDSPSQIFTIEFQSSLPGLCVSATTIPAS